MTEPTKDQLKALAPLVDHTLLKADAQTADIQRLCSEAISHGFASVCINPLFIPVAIKALEGSNVPVCTVIGFPLGANALSVKVAETKEALAAGAKEIDMVISNSGLKERGAASVQEEVAALRALGDYTLKVIIETCLLTKEEIVEACKGAVAGGADFVKTSTGFGVAGATVEDIALMRQTVGPNVGVKASGGIRTGAAMQAMVNAGANRIGIGSAMAIFGTAEAGDY